MSDAAPEPVEAPLEEQVVLPVSTTPMSDRELWWEVLAVLCIGVFPLLVIAIHNLADGTPTRTPYWLDSFYLTFQSAFTIVAVLYLMYRSGEPWSHFGLSRITFSDFCFGLLILGGEFFLGRLVAPYLPENLNHPNPWYLLKPVGVGDYSWMFIKFAVSAFSEELVVRAYLITRLERLMKSPLLAVLLAAILFASYHLYYGPGGGLIYILILGIYLGGWYLLLRRVWPLAIAHGLMNVLIDLSR